MPHKAYNTSLEKKFWREKGRNRKEGQKREKKRKAIDEDFGKVRYVSHSPLHA